MTLRNNLLTAFKKAGAEVGIDLTTKGDLHGFDSVDKRIPIGANDTVLTADSAEALGLKWAAAAGGGGFSTVFKTADETINSDDTLTDDVDLQWEAEANDLFAYVLYLQTSSGTTPDLKYDFSLPASGSGFKTGDGWLWSNDRSSLATPLAVGTPVITTEIGTPIVHVDIGFLKIGDAGTVAFQWAQNVSNVGDTILHEGSWIMFRKMN